MTREEITFVLHELDLSDRTQPPIKQTQYVITTTNAFEHSGIDPILINRVLDKCAYELLRLTLVKTQNPRQADRHVFIALRHIVSIRNMP
jgi:hypothetical protein